MFDLRDYQTDAIARTMSAIGQGHRPIICAYCGTGKTVMAAEVARDAIEQGKRVLWMTGREEIIRQAYATFSGHCGVKNVGVLCAAMQGEAPWWFYPPITLAGWDTLKARWNKADIWHVPADVVMWDECHLSLSKKMLETVVPHYANAECIGLTATPSRRNGRGLGSFFTRIVQTRRVRDLMDDGHLAECEYYAGKAVDTSKLKIDSKTRDYAERELAAASMEGVLIGDVIDNWLRLASNRHTIVFAVNIAHAQALCDRFKQAGVSAEVIHSQMSRGLRGEITEQFRRRDIQVLVNCQIATYGYDVPSINCAVIARATKSIVMWHQMVGRAVRPKPDGGFAMILDHGENVRRLGQIEDEIRWRLDEGKEAAGNTTRDGDATRNKSAEAPPIECGQCHYFFSRSRICPKCGWEKPAKAQDIETIDAELVRVSKAKSELTLAPDDPSMWLQMALGWCVETSRKRGAAWHAFQEKFGTKPPDDWWKLEPLSPDARVRAHMDKKVRNFARRKSYAARRGNARLDKGFEQAMGE